MSCKRCSRGSREGTSALVACGLHPDDDMFGKRVLVAEDDREVREALCDLLRVHGYEVVDLSDGEDVYEYVHDSVEMDVPKPRAHALLTDLRMPNMSGAEVLSYFRTLGWCLPTVVVTAFGDEETRRELLALGAAAVLEKPVDPDDLLGVLDRLTGIHEVDRGLGYG